MKHEFPSIMDAEATLVFTTAGGLHHMSLFSLNSNLFVFFFFFLHLYKDILMKSFISVYLLQSRFLSSDSISKLLISK